MLKLIKGFFRGLFILLWNFMLWVGKIFLYVIQRLLIVLLTAVLTVFLIFLTLYFLFGETGLF